MKKILLGVLILAGLLLAFSPQTSNAQAGPCNTFATGINQFIGCLWNWNADSPVPSSPESGSTLVGVAPAGPTFSTLAPETFSAIDFTDILHSVDTHLVGTSAFSIRWKGDFTFAPGTYRFTAGSDDGIRVKVSDPEAPLQTRIDKWVLRPYLEDSFTMSFCDTTTKHIEVEYFQGGFGARANFRWTKLAGGTTDNQLAGCLWSFRGSPVPAAAPTPQSGGVAPSGPVVPTPTPTTFTALDINWGSGGPNSFIGNDAFTARWEGNFTFSSGTYRFKGGSDDGIRVWLDDFATPKINQWVLRPYMEDSFIKTFPSTVTVPIRVEYLEGGFSARVKFGWEPVPGCPVQAPGVNQLTGCFYDWLSSSELPHSGSDGVPAGAASSSQLMPSPVPTTATPLNITWRTTPNPFLGADTFSGQWNGSFVFPPGTYKFSVNTNDGVRLKVKGNLVLDDWKVGPGRDRSVIVGLGIATTTAVPIELQYFSRGPSTGIRFGWSPSVSCVAL